MSEFILSIRIKMMQSRERYFHRGLRGHAELRGGGVDAPVPNEAKTIAVSTWFEGTPAAIASTTTSSAPEHI